MRGRPSRGVTGAVIAIMAALWACTSFEATERDSLDAGSGSDGPSVTDAPDGVTDPLEGGSLVDVLPGSDGGGRIPEARVRCRSADGGLLCAPMQTCCMAGTAGTCVDGLAAACPSSTTSVIECDDRTDCASGNRCCELNQPGSQIPLYACRPCTGPDEAPLCGEPSDCLEGETCNTSKGVCEKAR